MFESDIEKQRWMRNLPSYGPAWDAAIEYGIDISLIESNLQLSVEERLHQLEQMQLLHDALAPRQPKDEECAADS